MKLKKEGQSVDASVLIRRGNKIIMAARGREGQTWEGQKREKEKWAGSGVGGDWGVYRVRKLNRGL